MKRCFDKHFLDFVLADNHAACNPLYKSDSYVYNYQVNLVILTIVLVS